jgi:hypothetical protein
MNGRALNDRAIEVSPSSSRVLDRAAHSQPPGGPPLLTPFPPSKNRPRPGDWTCPSCGFSNFQRRTACFRCSFPAMGAGPGPDAYGQGYSMPPNAYGGGPPGGYGHPGMMSGGGGHGMHGGGYGGGNHMGGSGGGRGGAVPFRAGDWQCGNEGCKYHNFAKNVSCLRCGASRSNAAIVAEGGMNSFSGNNYGGPPPNMSMNSSMGSHQYGNMNQDSGAYSGGNMGGPPGGYSGQSYGPPSTYALPSGLGAPSPYMAGGYSQMAGNNGMQQQQGPPGQHGQQQQQQSQQGGFDSRAENAFNQGANSAAGGASGYSNNGYGQSGYGGNNDASGDPFSFLSSGMNNLGIDDRSSGRNGGQSATGATKSPQ